MDAERLKQLAERPAWPEEGEKDIDIVFAAVGRCLTEWESYESALASVYARLVCGVDVTPARLSFGAVRTFEGRLGMLRMAYKGFMMNRPGEIEDVERLLKLASKFCPRRNDVAHGSVRNCILARPDKYNSKESYCLFSGYADSEKSEKVTLSLPGEWSSNTYLPKYAYSAENINDLTSVFRYLFSDAGRVSRGVYLFVRNGVYPEPGSWH